MARVRHLTKAPIREAVLDLRIPEAAIATADLKALLDRVGIFDSVHEIAERSLTFELPARGPLHGSAETGRVLGVRGTSSDGLWVAQVRINGLTISRLQPYSSWEELAAFSRPIVDGLLDIARAQVIERLALRYINHFRLPHPVELDDYFLGLPRLPESLPQQWSNMVARVTLHDAEQDLTAHVAQGVLDDPDPERVGFILDIDAFKTAEHAPQPAVIWETFDVLRVFKNRIFFELITEHNAELHA